MPETPREAAEFNLRNNATFATISELEHSAGLKEKRRTKERKRGMGQTDLGVAYTEDPGKVRDYLAVLKNNAVIPTP